jgi:hypothetical protein
MYWKDLKPLSSFEYLGSCTRHGDLIIESKESHHHKSKHEESFLETSHQSRTQRKYSLLEIDQLSQSYRERKQRKSKLHHDTPSSFTSVKPLKISSTPPSLPSLPSKAILDPPHHEEDDPQDESPIQWIPKNEMKEQIDQSVRHIEWIGYLSLLGAVIVNIPWILFLVLIRETISI